MTAEHVMSAHPNASEQSFPEHHDVDWMSRHATFFDRPKDTEYFRHPHQMSMQQIYADADRSLIRYRHPKFLRHDAVSGYIHAWRLMTDL
jgi:hypothetical protein